MDPLTLATSAVALLAPYLGRLAERLAGGTVDGLSETAAKKLETMYERLKARSRGNRYAEPALERLEQQPDNELRQATFAETLAEIIEADPEFAAALSSIVDEARSAMGSQVVNAQISDAGAISIGGSMHLSGTNVAGRDLTIEDREHRTER